MSAPRTPKIKRPTVGFAFSGASSRSMFYIGFLEVLEENGFPIDYIAAMSGGAVVAASHACGTLPQLKRLAISLDKELVFNFIERSRGRGGLYSLAKVEALLRVYTKNLRFEDVTPRLGFVTTDIATGEEVILQMGDIARATCASCTLPGVFEPMEWGNKQLVDGGIVNVVPGNVARQAGVDLVIGIDMRATRHIFSSWQIVLKKSLDRIKQLLWPSPIDNLWQKLSNIFGYSEIDRLKPKSAYPGIFSVLDRSIGLAIEAQKKHKDENFDCDLLIAPDITHMSFWKRYLFLHFTDFSRTLDYYKSGRKTALQELPQMWQMLSEKQTAAQEVDQAVEKLLNNSAN
jgi:predicted acylesterase/phospholipase RssA